MEGMTDMLPPGLYEQVINTALNRERSAIPEARKSVAPIDRVETSIARSSPFTGAIHEPQMYTELKKDAGVLHQPAKFLKKTNKLVVG